MTINIEKLKQLEEKICTTYKCSNLEEARIKLFDIEKTCYSLKERFLIEKKLSIICCLINIKELLKKHSNKKVVDILNKEISTIKKSIQYRFSLANMPNHNDILASRKRKLFLIKNIPLDEETILDNCWDINFYYTITKLLNYGREN